MQIEQTLENRVAFFHSKYDADIEQVVGALHHAGVCTTVRDGGMLPTVGEAYHFHPLAWQELRALKETITHTPETELEFGFFSS